MKLTIVAIAKDGSIIAPKTKKNSPVIVQHLKRAVLIPSKAYREWEAAAIRSLLGEGIIARVPGDKPVYRAYGAMINSPVNCRALIYRDALRGDAVGYYQAIGDFLELAGIVENDKWLVSWDGSRLAKDSARPRIELELTPICDSPQLFG